MSTQLDAGDSDEHELGASVTEDWIWDHVWLDAIIGVVAGHHEKVSPLLVSHYPTPLQCAHDASGGACRNNGKCLHMQAQACTPRAIIYNTFKHVVTCTVHACIAFKGVSGRNNIGRWRVASERRGS